MENEWSTSINGWNTIINQIDSGTAMHEFFEKWMESHSILGLWKRYCREGFDSEAITDMWNNDPGDNLGSMQWEWIP